MDGEFFMSLVYIEGIKVILIFFKFGVILKDEGKYIWIGMNLGELMEVELFI